LRHAALDEAQKAEADALRDQLYSGYKKSVGGYLDFPVAAMVEAAKTLSQHIKDYRIDPQEQLDKETGDLVNFVGDLEQKYAKRAYARSRRSAPTSAWLAPLGRSRLPAPPRMRSTPTS